jgi:hypothetical protein
VAEEEASQKGVQRAAQEQQQSTEQQDVPALPGIAIDQADDGANFDDEEDGLQQGATPKQA